MHEPTDRWEQKTVQDLAVALCGKAIRHSLPTEFEELIGCPKDGAFVADLDGQLIGAGRFLPSPELFQMQCAGTRHGSGIGWAEHLQEYEQFGGCLISSDGGSCTLMLTSGKGRSPHVFRCSASEMCEAKQKFQPVAQTCFEEGSDNSADEMNQPIVAECRGRTGEDRRRQNDRKHARANASGAASGATGSGTLDSSGGADADGGSDANGKDDSSERPGDQCHVAQQEYSLQEKCVLKIFLDQPCEAHEGLFQEKVQQLSRNVMELFSTHQAHVQMIVHTPTLHDLNLLDCQNEQRRWIQQHRACAPSAAE